MTVRSEAGANSPKLGHIEVFRGVAVSLVLLYHLSAPGFAFAYVGVDSFFVISGFLMALLYGEMDDRTAVGDFYRRRLARLLPAYFCILVASIIAAAAIVLPNEFADAARYAKWSAALAPNVGFWMDASYFDSAYFRPMLNFWSLGVELQFYLVFPLIVLLHRRKPSLALLVAIGSLVLFLLLSRSRPRPPSFRPRLEFGSSWQGSTLPSCACQICQWAWGRLRCWPLSR